jgi:phosphatidylserine/phosphatidylglycerophosphate/cardiolipin synthase-like enzyme
MENPAGRSGRVMSTFTNIEDADQRFRLDSRSLADHAFSRAAGAPLIPGNCVRLLKDAGENYPAWLKAIREAKRRVHFECYIIHEDQAGETFADALIEKLPSRLCYPAADHLINLYYAQNPSTPVLVNALKLNGLQQCGVSSHASKQIAVSVAVWAGISTDNAALRILRVRISGSGSGKID